MNVVTRIAPSPTGDPHIGTAYIGLFNYVFAKRHGGRFILRIEDTDRSRYNALSEERILAMMDWLGLDPDESTAVGGPHSPYRQSERLDLYREHVDRLLKEDKAYRAFETAEELEEMRNEQKRKGLDPGYDGRSRCLSSQESDDRAASGEPFVVRLKTPLDGTTRVVDALRGEITFDNREVRDVVLLKSDGYPTYHLAAVVDDHLMGVTHVIRAEEWITSTPIHTLLYQAFSWETPVFVHMPLLRNPDETRTKLSKRKLDTSVDSYREQGIIPEALLNYLALMGWSMPDGREFFSLQEMIGAFSLDRISLGAPVFDPKKLRFMNAKYLRDLIPLENLTRRVKTLFESAGFAWEDDDYLLDIVDVLRPRVETLNDFVAHAGYFFEDDFSYDDQAKKKLASGQKYLEDLEREFSMLEFFDYDSVDDLVHDYVQEQGVGMGKVLQPLRAALTGRAQAPSVTDLLVILGKRKVMQRIGRALSYINAGLPDDKPQRPEKAKNATKTRHEAA
ncbi:MAG: glutamate--tRNA ligase [Trueperaceae bacterium]|nr:MAG: glutamate--tRNA ligase [Trueperaceae bacterium]